MRVIVDLHGGDYEDPVAKAEFREIKERVISEVIISATCPRRLLSCRSVKAGRTERTKQCGIDTSDDSSWP